MPDLFELTQLVTFMQRPQLQLDIAGLAREMATTEIRNHIGPTVYDAYTDLSPFRNIALQVAKRVVFNPEGFRSEKVDDYEYEIAIENLQPPELTESEMESLDKIVRRLAGRKRAFSVAPSYPDPCNPGYPRQRRCIATCTPSAHYCSC